MGLMKVAGASERHVGCVMKGGIHVHEMGKVGWYRLARKWDA